MRAKLLGILTLCLCFSLSHAAKEVALTIDDMPFLGFAGKNPGKLRREEKRFRRILEILREEKVPAAGFVVAGSIEQGQWQLLEAWRNDGHTIANHTYSHPNLNRSNTKKYIDNIKHADQVLTPLMPQQKYFRYPFLATGRNAEQQQAVEHFLQQNGYRIAPVTIDSKDFKFNARVLNIPWRQRKSHLPSIRRQYLNYLWGQTKKAEKRAKNQVNRPIKHILLIHMNYLNAYSLRELIQMYRQGGYRFISLEKAMQDPYYNS